MKRWLSNRSVLLLGVILFALGIAVASWETTKFRDAEYAIFMDQSLQMASVFARSAQVWLMRDNEEALGFAANLLLAGSGQYVRIANGNETVLDKRNGDPSIESLNLETNAASPEQTDPRAALRQGRLDVVVPIEAPNQRVAAIGTVQIGFSDTYAHAQVRSHRLLIFGLAGGSWLLLMLTAILAVRILNMRSRLATAQSLDSEADGIIYCGALEIDTGACAVCLCGQEIELTPKTFELLRFLARNVGKTFSDSDLLAELWTDAPYAASGDVKQCIYMLRRRLGAVCADPKRIIVNVKGFGYKLETPTEAILNRD
ncbi:winged helix-turn-helix domain-containing protein [Candidatus Bipolaricaulota bacterium]|nr:winged helix-turn-helix domain-containing protein [Candidatus Bipolaricaulota bacterium]